MGPETLTLDSIRELPLDEVAVLFVMRRSEGLTPAEQRVLTDWLEQDEAHQRALEGADHAWNCLENAEDNEILAAMRRQALAPRRPPSWIGWRSLAAVAAVLIIVGGTALIIAPAGKPEPGLGGQTVLADTAITYASAVGELKDIALPDGSRMTLDADSMAVGRFGVAGRSIELTRGRALFAIAHDASRPFTVLAADRRLVDVGTRFDVNLGPQILTVTLLDGRLAVGPKGQTIVTTTLEPGQQFIRRGDRNKVRTIGAGTEDAVAWRTGSIRFDDQPLTEAVAIMNRYSHDQIVIRDQRVAAIRVTGQFHAGKTDAFAETLTELYKLRSQRRASQIELLPGG